MTSRCGDSGGQDRGYSDDTSKWTCDERYERGWSVAPRLREEITLSKLKLRLDAAAAKNVPLLTAFCQLKITSPNLLLIPLTELHTNCWPAKVYFLRFQECKQRVRPWQQRALCVPPALCC
jgi:hypothetical protein